LTELKNIDIPSAVFSLGSTILETDQQGFGFAQEDEKISISLISFNNQIAYLDNKIQGIESKYDELKSKKIRNKKSTLQLLKDSQEKCSLKKKELLALESTYEFKNDKLKLFKQEKIDLKSIKVYSLSESVDKKVFYLKIGEDCFDLSKSKGRLTKIEDPELLNEVNPSGFEKKSSNPNPKYSLSSTKISKANGGRVVLKSSDNSHKLGIDFSVISIEVLGEGGGFCQGDFIPSSLLVSKKSSEQIGISIIVMNLKNGQRFVISGSIKVF
jgi:hypothetical protein